MMSRIQKTYPDLQVTFTADEDCFGVGAHSLIGIKTLVEYITYGCHKKGFAFVW